jgi:hypothetical protein
VLAKGDALFTAAVENGQSTGTPVRVLDNVGTWFVTSAAAALSSNGSLLFAGESVNRGRLVYPRWQVSANGALHPLWSGDGGQIFFRSGQKVLAVDVTFTPGGEPVLSQPRLLFERLYKFGSNLSIPSYSRSPDGQGLLMVKEGAAGRSLSFIANWFASLDVSRD